MENKYSACKQKKKISNSWHPQFRLTSTMKTQCYLRIKSVPLH